SSEDLLHGRTLIVVSLDCRIVTSNTRHRERSTREKAFGVRPQNDIALVEGPLCCTRVVGDRHAGIRIEREVRLAFLERIDGALAHEQHGDRTDCSASLRTDAEA